MTTVLVSYQVAQLTIATMLTAQKENDTTSIKPLMQRPPTLRSFEKVVHSIDGLRERLQELSVEQLSEADRKLQTMSLRLGELQQTLGVLSEIKQRMHRLQEIVQQAQVETPEKSWVDKPMPASSLLQVRNLLKFRRVIKLVKAAKDVSVLLDSADGKASLLQRNDTISEPSKPEHQLAENFPATEHTSVEPRANRAIVGTSRETKPEEVQSPVPTESDLGQTEPSDEPVYIIPPEERASSFQLNEIRGESIDAATTEHSALGDAVIVECSTTGRHADSEGREEVNFDRQLLDDLIRNYGEFNVLPSLPSNSQALKEDKQEAGISMTRVEPPTKLSLAVYRNLPTQRKDGELDRTLKKLIKDYGEYDLYSKQSPVNLKTGVAAAFLVLTLVLSGFYFFSSPKSVVPPNTSSAAQPQDKETAKGTDETVSRGAASSVEIPKPAEAASSLNATNNIVTKKTR
jgi:hypothetical protein